jgi:cytochrome c6
MTGPSFSSIHEGTEALLLQPINTTSCASAKDALTQYVGHNQNYGLTASLTPRERIGMDFAYNFNGVIQNALICFDDTPPTGVVLPFVTNAGSCAANDPSNPLLANSYYTNHTHFGMATVRFIPAKRFTVNVAATYKAKCAGCHGADGKAGTGPGKALGAHDFGSDEVKKMSDADLIRSVTDGKNKMPAYGKSLKGPEIMDLVAYIRGLNQK